MALVKIDGKEYNTDSFSQKTREAFEALKFCDAEIQTLQKRLAAMTLARNNYNSIFKAELINSKTTKFTISNTSKAAVTSPQQQPNSSVTNSVSPGVKPQKEDKPKKKWGLF